MKVTKNLLVLAALAVAVPFLTTQVAAAPVTWYLRNVVFEDGTTATGSFDFDAETSETDMAYSNIAITTTEPNPYGDPFLTSIIPPDASVLKTVPDSSLADLNGEQYLQFEFTTELTSSGGTVMMDTGGIGRSSERRCTSADCTSTSVTRSVETGGYVTTDGLMTPTEMPSDGRKRGKTKTKGSKGPKGGHMKGPKRGNRKV